MGRTAPLSATQRYAYDPSRDPLYTQAPRSSRSDHSDMRDVVNSPALYTVPAPAHPQNQPSRSYNVPQQFWTDHASSHLRITPYDTSGSDFNASQAFQPTLPASVFAQPSGQTYYPPTGASHPNRAAEQHAGPYDAVGYIRRDGAVYDREEVYEEYRPYDPNAHKRGQRGYHGSNETSR